MYGAVAAAASAAVAANAHFFPKHVVNATDSLTFMYVVSGGPQSPILIR